MSVNDPEAERTDSRSAGDMDRRSILKATSATLLGGGLAGCSGDGGGGGDGDSGGEGTPRATVEEDLSGLEFGFWETRYYRESPQAEEAIQNIVAEFEEGTGASVNLNLQDDDQPLIDAYNQGTYPVGHTTFVQSMGTWMQTGKIIDFEEYQDEFDYDVYDEVGPISDAAEFAFRGWDTGNTVLPITANIFAPFVGRMDHFEEADSLDPDEDFPPESYEELVDVAKTLEEETSTEVGYQPIGGQVDNQDVYFNQWTSAKAGADGYFFNDDWSDLNVTNDSWRTVTQQNLDLWHEHELGTPATPGMLDEEIPPLHLDGRVSMSQQAPMNLPAFRERGGDIYEENIQWATPWAGETGTQGRALIPGAVLTEAPEDADEANWERKQDGVLELLSYFNSPQLQVEVMPELGFLPARQDIWPEISNDRVAGDFIETLKETAETAKYSYPAHPDWGTIGYDIFGVKHEAAFQGEMTADEVLDETYEEGMEVVENSQWG